MEGVFHLTDAQLQVFADVAVAIALDAGAILRNRFGEPHDISFKGPLDLVTEADKAAESLIAARLRSAFPDHDLMGEEGSRSENTGARLRWVIDPLDGTTNFAHGLPTFAVSIALEDAGQPVAGVIYDPMRNELFRAIKGGGATLNGEPIRVSRTEHVHSAILVTGFAHTLEQRRLQGMAWCGMLERARALRQTGSAALNLCYVAAGRLDGYWERGIQPWDVSAGALLVAEAGGQASNREGGPFNAHDRVVVATNGLLHQELVAILTEYPDD
jgi:myo-inositol-1(or 4)-monophosphatase